MLERGNDDDIELKPEQPPRLESMTADMGEVVHMCYGQTEVTVLKGELWVSFDQGYSYIPYGTYNRQRAFSFPAGGQVWMCVERGEARFSMKVGPEDADAVRYGRSLGRYFLGGIRG